MSIEVEWLDSQPSEEGFMVMLRGDFGTGKTYFVKTCEDFILLEFDKGERTLRNHKGAYVKRGQIKRLSETISFIRKTTTLPNGNPVKGFIFDSFTGYVDEVLIPETRGSKDSMTQADWGTFFTKVHTLFVACQELTAKGLIFVFNVHLEAKEDKVSGEMLLGPSIPGSMFYKAGRYFDLYLKLKPHPTKFGVIDLRNSRDRLEIVPDRECPDMRVWLKNLASGNKQARVQDDTGVNVEQE